MAFLIGLVTVINLVCILLSLFLTEEWDSKYVLFILTINLVSIYYFITILDSLGAKI
jgi:hypothetical protein